MSLVSEPGVGGNSQTIRKADTKTGSTNRPENVAQFPGGRSAERPDVLRGLASPARARILRLLHRRPGVNINDIAEALNLPQSTVSSNLQILESAGLIRTETHKGRKGNQKLCFSAFDEVLVILRNDVSGVDANAIEVAMPIGLYTSCEVSAPCGLCSPKGVIGLLDVPGTFLDPDRMNAGLMWFTRGFVEYQFPNNARHVGRRSLRSMLPCPRRPGHRARRSQTRSRRHTFDGVRGCPQKHL